MSSLLARPIRFTDHLAQHRALLQALGGTVVTDAAPEWVVYALGSGRVALHQADAKLPAGLTQLGFETGDLDTWAAAVSPEGFTLTVGEVAHGRAATVTGPDGTVFTVDPRAEAAQPAAPSPLSVMPIWYSSDTIGARRTLVALGARERLVSDTGNWVDLTCPDGGMAAVHEGQQTEVTLAFEYAGDVDALVPALESAGIEAMVIDENYNRTLLVPDPDRPGQHLWINGRIDDLYGYRRADNSGGSQ